MTPTPTPRTTIAGTCAALSLLAGLLSCGGTETGMEKGDPPPARDTAGTEKVQDMNEDDMEILGQNRLGNETSPYLLQHRYNPVHWYPWGEEAFAAARERNVPVFLSVGYSTCYWCHVMERESFENEDIAGIMNRSFVCIKVDREERPDVDDIYMHATRLLSRGNGGWPMSVWLEPESLKPFMAGTYFPPEDRGGRKGFPTVMAEISAVWEQQRERVIQVADNVARTVVEQVRGGGTVHPVDQSVVENAIRSLQQSYDPEHGGFGRGTNKFPTPVNLRFLMRTAWDRPEIRTAVVHTLDRMAMGGMYDQIGGGFHRYSTDRKWLVPHFEKMLYDNGQLASTYAEAFRLTGDGWYAAIVDEILAYVLREMTTGEGHFYSAQDAEVNHLEGDNYLWTAVEVRQVLEEAGEGDAVEHALRMFGLDAGTNFRDPHHPEEKPRNVLYLPERPDISAQHLGMTEEEYHELFTRIATPLLAARSRRDQPIRDDKTIASWNGLMITGFADAGRILERPEHVAAAARAAGSLLATMREENGDLLRTSREGTAKIPAFLEDYACVAQGLLALYRATDDRSWLEEAAALVDRARSLFWDEDTGGWFDTRAGQEDLFVRFKSTYDGATPSGGGIMLHNLIDLHTFLGHERYLDDAQHAVAALSRDIVGRPTACITSTEAAARMLLAYPDRMAVLLDSAVSPDRPVQVTLVEKALILDGAGRGQLTLEMTIASPFHVNSQDPGLDNVVACTINLDGTDDLDFRVDWPTSQPMSFGDDTLMVWEGRIRIPIECAAGRGVGETIQLSVIWQACTSQACQEPRTFVIPVRVTRE